MKIKVEGEKIVKAVRKLDGIEMVLESPEDAKEAISLILRKTDLFNKDHFDRLKEVGVSAFQEYKTSAVDYRVVFLLEFVFQEDTPEDSKVSVIKHLQDFFHKV